MSPIKATRSNPQEYTITNNSGASMRVSLPGTPGAFSPEELLQAAVAGCAVLSAEAQLNHHLGEEFQAEATVNSTKAEGLIAELLLTLNVDVSALDPTKVDKLIAGTAAKIEKLCAVKRSVGKGIPTTTVIVP